MQSETLQKLAQDIESAITECMKARGLDPLPILQAARDGEVRLLVSCEIHFPDRPFMIACEAHHRDEAEPIRLFANTLEEVTGSFH